MPHQGAFEFRVARPIDALCVGVLATQVFLDTYATAGLRPDLAREALANYSPTVFETRIRDATSYVFEEQVYENRIYRKVLKNES